MTPASSPWPTSRLSPLLRPVVAVATAQHQPSPAHTASFTRPEVRALPVAATAAVLSAAAYSSAIAARSPSLGCPIGPCAVLLVTIDVSESRRPSPTRGIGLNRLWYARRSSSLSVEALV
jgi:hypothetical protein